MQMKNDISFILDDYLNLYEHQSTWNPNMPLRGLFYIADLYKDYIGSVSNLHQKTLVKIPNLKYIVFYNGTDDYPDNTTLNLSDAFLHQEEHPDVEITAHMLNINYGHNKKLLDSCLELKGYSVLINKIRLYQKSGFSLENAIKQSVNYCMAEGFLTELLRKEGNIIMGSILSEFDEEVFKEIMRREGYEDGFADGTETGIHALILNCKEVDFPEDKIISRLCSYFELNEEQARSYLQKYSD